MSETTQNMFEGRVNQNTPQVPKPGTNERKCDTRVKEDAKKGVYNYEVMHWCTLLTPYLTKATSDRQVQPRPERVKEDSRSHQLRANADERVEDKTEALAKAFIAERLKEWKPKGAEPPATREEVNEAFTAFCKPRCSSVPNPIEALVGGQFLFNHLDRTRFKVMHGGVNYAIYKARKKVIAQDSSEAEDLAVVTLNSGTGAAASNAPVGREG